MAITLIKNAILINEGASQKGNVLIKNELIHNISYGACTEELEKSAETVIDAKGKLLIPGCIDDQVHFREPGLTHKADIHTESMAAVAGGITSFMEMPNTNPQTVTIDELERKYATGAQSSVANYSFYMGATNENLDEIVKTDPSRVCGIKVFMGSSTGNMLVDKDEVLKQIFKNAPCLVATHCEDEETIRRNSQMFKAEKGLEPPFSVHPQIRSAEACYISSSKAVELAAKYNTRLHVLHLSTAQELSLFDNKTKLEEKLITAEVCIHHLWFNDSHYDTKKAFIKWNPAVKTEADRLALLAGLENNALDVVATDHAPHTFAEKQNTYYKTPSGGPMVQHALSAMIDLHRQGYFSMELIVEKMCHAPARLFQIEKRGFIREGYFADLVLIDTEKPYTVSKNNIMYKCEWSPMEGHTFTSSVIHTWVNGYHVYNDGDIDPFYKGMRLSFNR